MLTIILYAASPILNPYLAGSLPVMNLNKSGKAGSVGSFLWGNAYGAMQHGDSVALMSTIQSSHFL
jgi:hypothetical protein